MKVKRREENSLASPQIAVNFSKDFPPITASVTIAIPNGAKYSFSGIVKRLELPPSHGGRNILVEVVPKLRNSHHKENEA